MNNTLSRLSVSFLAIAALAGCQSAGGPPAARVEGHEISIEEVDESIRQDLYMETYGEPTSSKAHEARREKIDALIDDYLLSSAAEKAGTTIDEWILAEAALLPPVSDELVQKFFDENHDKFGQGVTIEQLSPQIRNYLEQGRQDAVIRMLREASDVAILIDRPRLEVAAVGPQLGPDSAAITMVEFSDFQCPFCERVVPTLKELAKRYPDSLRIIYRHQPLPFHPNARPAAEASVCAEAQGKFWEYHDLLFANRKALAAEDLIAYAEQIELDLDAFRGCLALPTTAARIDADMAAATRVGATGTPAFYINGIKLTGAKPIEAFAAIIDEELQRLAP